MQKTLLAVGEKNAGQRSEETQAYILFFPSKHSIRDGTAGQVSLLFPSPSGPSVIENGGRCESLVFFDLLPLKSCDKQTRRKGSVSLKAKRQLHSIVLLILFPEGQGGVGEGTLLDPRDKHGRM